MTFAQTCEYCGGSGKEVSENCDKCRGRGFKLKREKFEVNIPEGVDTGNRIRVSGKGNKSKRGQRGDLYLQIKVKEDKHFVRSGNDIYFEVPVFFTQVALGATINIPTLKGEVELKIPRNASDKQQFRFRGEGIKSVQGHGKGDFVAQIKIEYPKSLDSEQEELLIKLSESFGVDSKPSTDIIDTLTDKIKGWFS
jgi:molecular chaperone DnaJ